VHQVLQLYKLQENRHVDFDVNYARCRSVSSNWGCSCISGQLHRQANIWLALTSVCAASAAASQDAVCVS
jgi:hypothetical protein